MKFHFTHSKLRKQPVLDKNLIGKFQFLFPRGHSPLRRPNLWVIFTEMLFKKSPVCRDSAAILQTVQQCTNVTSRFFQWRHNHVAKNYEGKVIFNKTDSSSSSYLWNYALATTQLHPQTSVQRNPKDKSTACAKLGSIYMSGACCKISLNRKQTSAMLLFDVRLPALKPRRSGKPSTDVKIFTSKAL